MAAPECQWMYADVFHTDIGRSLASFNPLRWSDPIPFDIAATQLEEILLTEDRPIFLRHPPGVGSPTRQFHCMRAAIDFLETRNGVGHTHRFFSKWRCLLWPQWACNPQKALPYAVLELNIDRARDLLPADTTGFSDPYVVIQVNNEATGQKTEVKPMTLAPTWEEKFEVEVFRPDSVLNIVIWDYDLGTDLGTSTDDLLGHVDIKIARLPKGHVVRGWFDVLAPGNWEGTEDDHTAAYERRGTKLIQGQIWLEMQLRVQDPFAECFAFCIGALESHTPLPSLNLNSLFADISTIVDRVGYVIGFIQYELNNFSSIILATAIACVWWPRFILPTVVSISVFALIFGEEKQEDAIGPEIEEGYEDQPAITPSTFSEAILQVRASSGASSRTAIFQATEMALPEQNKVVVRTIQKHVATVGAFLHYHATIVYSLKTPRRLGCICCFVIILWIDQGFKDYQALMLQIILTCWFLKVLITHSAMLRWIMGFRSYLHYRRLVLAESAKSVPSEEQESSSSGDEFVADVPGVVMRSASQQSKGSEGGRPRKRRMTLGNTMGLTLRRESSVACDRDKRRTALPHNYVLFSHSQPTWCEDCGHFIWLWKGRRCSLCHRSLCESCTQVDGRDGVSSHCRGAPMPSLTCCVGRKADMPSQRPRSPSNRKRLDSREFVLER